MCKIRGVFLIFMSIFASVASAADVIEKSIQEKFVDGFALISKHMYDFIFTNGRLLMVLKLD